MLAAGPQRPGPNDRKPPTSPSPSQATSVGCSSSAGVECLLCPNVPHAQPPGVPPHCPEPCVTQQPWLWAVPRVPCSVVFVPCCTTKLLSAHSMFTRCLPPSKQKDSRAGTVSAMCVITGTPMPLDELLALKAIDIWGQLPWWHPQVHRRPAGFGSRCPGWSQQDASGGPEGASALTREPQGSEGPSFCPWHGRPQPLRVPLLTQ